MEFTILIMLKNNLHNEESEASATLLKESDFTANVNNIEGHAIPDNYGKLTLTGGSDKLLVDAIDEFIKNYIEISSRGDAKPPSKATIISYKGILNEFVRIIGGDKIKCCEVTKSTIKNYDKHIWKVPKSFMKFCSIPLRIKIVDK